ncbi:MAG: DUF2029 domain-containing protein [Proteobacteria bacterium]|nr:DUF2029 domain-containing protein [Pseudomonadota bacterium]
MRGVIAAMRSGSFLTERRVLLGASLLLVLELLLLAIAVAASHGAFGGVGKPSTTDFMSFYGAGRVVNAGTPALTYNHDVHWAAQQATSGAETPYIFFYYPPVYLLLCSILARLPYLVAFVGFQALTLAMCLVVVRQILDKPRWSVIVPLIGFAPAVWTLGTGQNAFLTASLFGAAMLWLERRPVVAGLLIGALCYKPHFGLLIPFALAAGGYWRAFASAAASAIMFCLLSVVLFGWETWAAYFTAMAGSESVYVTGHLDFAAFITPFGTARALTLAPKFAYAAQAVATLLAAAIVSVVWYRRVSLPIRAAVLTAATPFAIPVALMYDQVMCGIAMAWLVRAGRERGFLPWHRVILAALFVWPLFALNLDPKTYILAPPTVTVGVLALALAAARQEWRMRPAAPARLAQTAASTTIG